MKRFHVHMSVIDLSESIRFYSALFGAEPTVVKPDYAKWMLDDPRINFAISKRGQATGINHLGLQADDETELETIHANLQKADTTIASEKAAHCCYAVSDKYWVADPQGIAWESFRSLDSIPIYGSDRTKAAGASCCSTEAVAPETAQASSCCDLSTAKATSCCS